MKLWEALRMHEEFGCLIRPVNGGFSFAKPSSFNLSGYFDEEQVEWETEHIKITTDKIRLEAAYKKSVWQYYTEDEVSAFKLNCMFDSFLHEINKKGDY